MFSQFGDLMILQFLGFGTNIKQNLIRKDPFRENARPGPTNNFNGLQNSK